MQLRNQRVRVTIRRDMLVKQPRGWLSDWTTELEAQGCLAPGGGLKLADEIAESLPLDPTAAFRLLYASPLEVGPRVRLQVVSPILREGAAPDTPILQTVETSANGGGLTVALKATKDLIGYETAWYAVQPKSSGIGFTIAPLYADRHIQREPERRPQPAVNYFQFPADAAFYRLFHKAGETEYTQFVVAANTRAELQQRAANFETGKLSCQQAPGGLCVAIPKAVAVNLMLPVTVNGSEIVVSWGARISEAIRAAGVQQPKLILAQLTVYKTYRGLPVPVVFDRAGTAILDLILTGGEILSWR